MTDANELRLLEWLCVAVEERFSYQAACIAATALVVTVAGELGVALRPQPVSIWSGDTKGQSATGKRAREFGLSIGGKINSDSVAGDADSWFREVGHLIAVSDEHRVLLDATYGQFRRPGAPHRTVMMQVPSMTVAGEEAWSLQAGEWHVRYWPVDKPSSWEIQYAAASQFIVPKHLPYLMDGAVSMLEGLRPLLDETPSREPPTIAHMRRPSHIWRSSDTNVDV